MLPADADATPPLCLACCEQLCAALLARTVLHPCVAVVGVIHTLADALPLAVRPEAWREGLAWTSIAMCTSGLMLHSYYWSVPNFRHAGVSNCIHRQRYSELCAVCQAVLPTRTGPSNACLQAPPDPGSSI